MPRHVHQEVSLAAPPDRVYRILTDSALYADCTGFAAEIGAREGEAFSIFGGKIVGRHLELVHGRRIRQTWRARAWHDDADSIVRIELHPVADGTLLVLDHEDIPDARHPFIASHWEHRCWHPLRSYAPLPGVSAVAAHATLPEPLRRAFPWPSHVDADPYLVDLDGGGRFRVDRLIARQENQTVLEIGSFLGGSTRRWLNVSPAVRVIAVDPWVDGWAGTFVGREESWFHWPRPSSAIVQALDAKDGLYATFLANLASHADRVIAVRARSEDALPRLAGLGLDPGVVYIDADKKRADLDVCFRLWPRARLTGDDYLWNADGGYPMQAHVHAFAAEHGFSVEHTLQTWVLVPPPRD